MLEERKTRQQSAPGSTKALLKPMSIVNSDDESVEDTLREYKQPKILGFTNPLTVQWFFSVVGSEYCHVIFWIAKDLSWMQSWRHLSIFFGELALAWSLLLLFHALRTLNIHEIWNFIALFLWLFANFWWMLGEAHDYEYPNRVPISIRNADQSALILEIALVWLLFYYCIVLPFHLLPSSARAFREYDDGSLYPRFACFANFRQYENVHMVRTTSAHILYVHACI